MCTIWVSEYWILRPLHVAYRESNGAYKNCINILRLPGKDRNATHPPRHLKLPWRLYRTRPSAAIYAPNQPRVYDTVIVSVELSRHIEALHQQWHLLWTRKPVFLKETARPFIYSHSGLYYLCHWHLFAFAC